VVELVVLVGDQRLVPAAQLAEERDGVGPERDVVDLLLGLAVVVDGSADPERATERRSYRPAGWCHSVTVLAAADPAPRALLQAGHVAAHVVGLDGRVRVDADQPAAAGRGERDVERAGDPAVGVVVQLDPRVGSGPARHDVGGVVRGAPVDDHHDLQVAVVLGLDPRHRRADEARLVAGRHDDRDQVGIGVVGDVVAACRSLVRRGPVRCGHGVRSPALVGRVGHVLHLLALVRVRGRDGL
jgi:hypothetical protein